MLKTIFFTLSLMQYVFSYMIYPLIDEFSIDCKLPDGSNGTCTVLKECPAAITSKKFKTCYFGGFGGFEEFVCCKNIVWEDIKLRPITENCGAGPPRSAISNGLSTEYKEFPYMVALGWQSLIGYSLYDYKCGGVLITKQFVLTAAHCAVINGLPPVVALIGGGNLTDTSYKPIQISQVLIHPGYRTNAEYHDIALIKLAKCSEDEPICIWGSFPLDELSVIAIGYGHTQFAGASSESLLKAYLSIVSNKECCNYYNQEPSLPYGVVSTQLCAKDPESIRDTCQGDSGGPIILYSTDQYGATRPFVVGITSFGRSCGLEPPGIYTRVSEYIDWIEKIAFQIY